MYSEEVERMWSELCNLIVANTGKIGAADATKMINQLDALANHADDLTHEVDDSKLARL